MSDDKQQPQVCYEQELQTLRKLQSGRDRPEGLKPFDVLVQEGLRAKELQAAKQPVVAYWCNFVPDELVLAAGAIPVRLDTGCLGLHQAGQQLVPYDTCCLVRADAGAVLQSVWQVAYADMIVTPTSCDGKKKLASILSKDRQVHVLNLPPFDRDERWVSSWLSEIFRLKDRLEKLTGKRITRRRLQDAVQLVNQRTRVLRRLNFLRSHARLPISGADAFFVMQASFTADCGWWIEKGQNLLEELEDRLAQGLGIQPKARILVTGSPILWPDYRWLFLLAEAGAEVVADEMCSATQRLYNPVVVDERTLDGLMQACAERVLLPSTCPCFTDSDGRFDRLYELIDAYKIDGVVSHTLRLCQLYDADSLDLVAGLKKKGVPVLQLQTEMGPQDDGRLRNRIDAFVEILRPD